MDTLYQLSYVRLRRAVYQTSGRSNSRSGGTEATFPAG